jgi:hypothetical protein
LIVGKGERVSELIGLLLKAARMFLESQTRFDDEMVIYFGCKRLYLLKALLPHLT